MAQLMKEAALNGLLLLLLLMVSGCVQSGFTGEEEVVALVVLF